MNHYLNSAMPSGTVVTSEYSLHSCASGRCRDSCAPGRFPICRDRGHEVTIVTMTPGDCGTVEHGPEEISAIRRQEAARAAKMIGAEYICAEFRDLAIFIDDPSRRRITELLRRTQPDIVLTASPVDYHCDHEATSALVRDACFAAPAPNYQSAATLPLCEPFHISTSWTRMKVGTVKAMWSIRTLW